MAHPSGRGALLSESQDALEHEIVVVPCDGHSSALSESTLRSVMGLLDLLLGSQHPSLPIVYAEDANSLNIVRLTDGVYDLLYNTSYAERCHRDGQYACSAWLHGQMDDLGIVHAQHERLIILAKFRNGDRSRRDLPKS
jgi:hypothetical protein